MDDHAEAIKAAQPWGGTQYFGTTWADYGAAQVRHEFELRGIPNQAANKEINVGIALVQKLLRENRLFIFDTCPGLISEMRTYRWHPTLDRVIKDRDDCQDALRYALISEHCAFGGTIEPLKIEKRTRRLI